MRIPIIIIIGVSLFFAACTKNADNNAESALFGVWVNNNLPADTLWFINKAGKNVLRYHDFFSSGAPIYTESEYFFKDGKLSIALGGPSGTTHLIQSFTWKQENKQFDILMYELYFFMSSSSTHAVYNKI